MEGISKATFKYKFNNYLQESGIYSKLKAKYKFLLQADLRTKLITELKPNNTKKRNKNKTLFLALDCLVIDYLKTCGYECTLSVLIPESGITDHQLLDEHEIISTLGLDKIEHLLDADLGVPFRELSDCKLNL
jgi:hypothetical protein